jgi:hypothetical protein
MIFLLSSLTVRMRRTSVFLYYKTQAAGEANRRTVCEGELTLLRSRVVGNKNLFKVAQQLELGNTNFSQFLRSGSGPTYSREDRKKISVSDPDQH